MLTVATLIAALWSHRRYIWHAAAGDVRHRYAGSVGGAAWNILHPLALLGVYSLVFSRVSAGGLGGGGYALNLCCVLLPWLAFSEATSRGTRALVAGAMHLRRLPIPEEVFIAWPVVASALGLATAFSLFAAVGAAAGLEPSWTWLLAPIPLAALLAMALGASLALGAVHAFFRDTAQVVTIGLQLAFWSYPIAYSPTFLPEWAQRAVAFSPLHGPLSCARSLMLENRVPELGPILACAGWTAALLAAGSLVLSRLRPQLRDVL